MTLVSCLDGYLSQLGIIGNEVSRLEEKLEEQLGGKFYLDAGKGRRLTGKPLVRYTKRVIKEYRTLMKSSHKESARSRITKFLNTPISFKTEGQSPGTVPYGSRSPEMAFCKRDYKSDYKYSDYKYSDHKYSDHKSDYYSLSEGDYCSTYDRLPESDYCLSEVDNSSSNTMIDEATLSHRLKFDSLGMMCDDTELTTDNGSGFHVVGVSHVSRGCFVAASPLEIADLGQCHM